MKVWAKIILTIILIFSFNALSAQSGWQWVNPVFPGNPTTNGIQFINQNTGWIYGIRYLKTTNGGVFWENLSGIGNVSTMCFANAYTGFYTRSTNNNIYKTTNGGYNWVSVFSFGGVYNEMNFYDQNIGGAVTGAGKIISTTDGGNTWATEINLGPNMTSINYFNSLTGYVFTSSGDYFKTTNSGVNWFTVPFFAPISKSKFINSTTGFAVGDFIYKTTDAGLTWFSKGSSGGSQIKSIIFTSALRGYILSVQGGVYYTTNGGENWSPLALTGTDYSGMAFTNGTTGFITRTSGPILKTTNQGVNWTELSNNFTTQPLRRVQPLDANTVWTAGDAGKLNRTIDGGVTWESINTGMQLTANWFQFINSQTGWVCDDITNFKRTTDGGNTWVNCPIVGTIDVTNFTFINANTGWACCYQSNRIFKTTNGGTNWTMDYNQADMHPAKIYFLNQLTGWRIISSNLSGIIQKTTNGGTNWAAPVTVSSQNNIFFINENTGWICGGYYYTQIAKTTNGGLNWTGMTGVSATDVFFFNEQTGWAAGGASYTPGRLIRTTNGGVNWASVSQVGDSMLCVSFYDANIGWTSGMNGALLKTTSGGIVSVSQISSEIPNRFLLQQNYPNPFNPTTKINYEIKSSGFVSLKIFDLLGKEVASLVNEKQNAGSYTVNFDSFEFNLPSGIYFYTLKTDGFTETKKMVLLK